MKFYALLFLSLIPFTFYGQSTTVEEASSWSEVLSTRQGKVVFYYYPASPFIYLENGNVTGIEFELANSFVEFIEDGYNVELDIEWVIADQFDDVIYKLKDFKSGVFGASSLSITEERAELINFTPPYIPDISVLASTSDIPIAHSKEEFFEVIDGLTAVSVRSSTLESGLINLREKSPIDYDIIQIDNAGGIMQTLDTMEKAFGYVDLPSFLMALGNGSTVQRQYFFPRKLPGGLSLAFPKGSDWKAPVTAYFNSEKYAREKPGMILKYLGSEVTELMKTISNSAEFGPYEEIVLLTQERELQAQELLASAIKAQQDARTRNLLTGGMIVFVLIALLFYSRYVLRTKANLALADKQKQLEELNEEKYNLIKVIDYDMRVSLTKISGLSRLYILENDPLTEDQRKIIEHILDTSDQLGGAIGNILDIDANDASQLNLRFEKINVNEIIEKVMSSFENQANEAGVVLKAVVRTHSFAKGDKPSLLLVMENLLSNAIHVSGKNTEVTLSIQESEDKIIVKVSDQGPGFKEEDKLHIFEKSHDGLELPIVKMYTDLMKGTITCESELGKGTTFSVSLDKA